MIFIFPNPHIADTYLLKAKLQAPALDVADKCLQLVISESWHEWTGWRGN